MSTYDTDLTIATDFGELQDVPATFDFTAEYERAHPDSGNRGTWEITDIELDTIWFGGGVLNRDDAVKFIGRAVIECVEEIIADEIAEKLMAGDLLEDAA